MAGPPPPPPPPPPGLDLPPPPPASMPAGRDALLGDIRKGMNLKKAVTVDKSKPQIDSKMSILSSAPLAPKGHVPMPSAPSFPSGGPPQLGDIFAGGIPKLKSVKDNRSGIVPTSAPKIPLPPGQAPSASQNEAPAAPRAPLSRPHKRNLLSASSLAPPVPGPPPLPSVVPPLPSAAPPLPSMAPPVPSAASPLPSVPSVPATRPSASLKVPKLPPSRPKKLGHLKSSSVSSMGSFESADFSIAASAPLAPSAPAAPPQVPSAPPPLPNAVPPPPPPPSVSVAGPGKTTPAAPPLPLGGLPFLADINAKRDESHVVDKVSPSGGPKLPSASGIPSIPTAKPSVPLSAPPLPHSAPPLPHSTPPPPLSAPRVPPLPLNSAASLSGAPLPPPPPPGAFGSSAFKSSGGPPAPPPPPPGGLGGPSLAKAAAKPAAPSGGALPFIDQINAKRNEAFVIDGTSSGYSTTLESTPAPPSSSGSLAPKTAPPVPSGIPISSPVAPSGHPQKSSQPLAGLLFLNQINARRLDSGSTAHAASSPSSAPPSAPPIPTGAPPPSRILAPPPAPMAPLAPPSLSGSSGPPPPPAGLPFLNQINSQRSDDSGSDSESSVPYPSYSTPQSTPIPSAVPPPPTSAPPLLLAPLLPKLVPPQLPNAPPPPTLSSHSTRSKRAAPPPPPSTMDQQQSAGLSLRKISALAYTINTHQKNGADSKPQKIVIDDSRYKFVNADSLPHPRRFEGKQKLYPSGRGSSVPLDLSIF